jgi:hypothetical protein
MKYKTTLGSIVFLEKPIVTQLVQKFPACYGIWRFKAVFARICHWSLSSGKWKPCSCKITFNIILPSMPRSSNWSILSGFQTKIFYSSSMCAICPALLIFLDLVTLIIFGEEYTVWSSLVCIFSVLLHSSFPSPNIQWDFRFLWCQVWRWLSLGLLCCINW